jgi:hypothetical protein
MLDEARLAAALTEERETEVCVKRLVREANEAGGEDNITVIVVDLIEEGTTNRRRGRSSPMSAVPARRPKRQSRSGSRRNGSLVTAWTVGVMCLNVQMPMGGRPISRRSLSICVRVARRSETGVRFRTPRSELIECWHAWEPVEWAKCSAPGTSPPAAWWL